MPRPLRLFLIAVQFLTRLPVPRDLNTSEEELGAAAAFFPLVGLLVGGLGALLQVLLLNLLPPSTCVVLVLVYASVMTNALHEDGLADTVDGFGGGWGRERVLEIMRDSRVGTFGALALVLLVLAKYNFLSVLDPAGVWRWLIVAHTAARWTILPLCLWLPYARSDGQGKLVARRVGNGAMAIATLTFLATLALLPWPSAAMVLAVAVAVVSASGWYYRSRIGGITGDCLGATNQLTEVAVYLAAVAASRYQ
ncbi:MAG TPA: adenosylcobinamide-GDP ribazoletransferase [Blastocatellia bacterium]|nr:adenosylcobinamide-GDP ribazoletransferase [Blastocatellia bacterium]